MTLNEVKALDQLDLAVLTCDGSDSLVSLRHRIVIADAADVAVEDYIPRIDLGGDDGIEVWAARAAGLDPDNGFPGWDAIFDYLKDHRHLVDSHRPPATRPALNLSRLWDCMMEALKPLWAAETYAKDLPSQEGLKEIYDLIQSCGRLAKRYQDMAKELK